MPDSPKFNLVTELPKKPPLKVGLERVWLPAFRSLFSATGLMLLLFGSLAAIQIAHQSLKKKKITPPLFIESAVSEETESNPRKVNLEALATPPPPSTPLSSSLALEQNFSNTFVIPEGDLPVVDSFVFEEESFDNPFPKKAPAQTTPTKVKKKTQKKAVASKTSASRKKNTLAKKRRAEARRQAVFAKKIAKKSSIVSSSTPKYPRSARRKGLEGKVIVSVTVGISGKVVSSRISKSSQHQSLDAAALKAARRYRFKPAKNGLGQPIADRKSIPFVFKLRG